MYLKINNPIQILFLEELVAKKKMSLLVDQVHFGLANKGFLNNVKKTALFLHEDFPNQTENKWT